MPFSRKPTNTESMSRVPEKKKSRVVFYAEMAKEWKQRKKNSTRLHSIRTNVDCLFPSICKGKESRSVDLVRSGCTPLTIGLLTTLFVLLLFSVLLVVAGGCQNRVLVTNIFYALPTKSVFNVSSMQQMSSAVCRIMRMSANPAANT